MSSQAWESLLTGDNSARASALRQEHCTLHWNELAGSTGCWRGGEEGESGCTGRARTQEPPAHFEALTAASQLKPACHSPGAPHLAAITAASGTPACLAFTGSIRPECAHGSSPFQSSTQLTALLSSHEVSAQHKYTGGRTKTDLQFPYFVLGLCNFGPALKHWPPALERGLSPACHSPGAVGGGSQGPGTPPQHADHPTAGGAPPALLPQIPLAGRPRGIPAPSSRTAVRCCAAAMT